MGKKLISVCVPCFNEQDNVKPMADTLVGILDRMSEYDYEIIFRDNDSTDSTVQILREIASENKRIKVILNCRNSNKDVRKNTFLGRVSGDIIITIPCDFQDPPEMIPEFVGWYEKGYEVVLGQKIASDEGKIKYGLRQVFYGIIDIFSKLSPIS